MWVGKLRYQARLRPTGPAAALAAQPRKLPRATPLQARSGAASHNMVRKFCEEVRRESRSAPVDKPAERKYAEASFHAGKFVLRMRIVMVVAGAGRSPPNAPRTFLKHTLGMSSFKMKNQ